MSDEERIVEKLDDLEAELFQNNPQALGKFQEFKDELLEEVQNNE